MSEAAGVYGKSSLYVGDLEANVNEGHLADLFGQVAPVLSVRVCRDQNRQSSLRYAYVNFTSPQDAANAMEQLNFTLLNGKPIRIMFSHRDPSIRKSGCGNVFIKNLDASIDNKELYDIFANFGTILSCKVVLDNNGKSLGFGYVQFESNEAAQAAIDKLNGVFMNDKQVYVGLFVRRQERIRVNGSPKFTNVFVKNFSETTTEDDLKKVFGIYGPITSVIVMKDQNGKSKCFGFVNFQDPESATVAIDKLNGTSFNDDKVWYVGRAQKKAERESELKNKFEQEKLSRYEKLRGANLFLKNLDDNINDEKLMEMFSEFGNVTSCKVMLDQQGHSKGSGFVAFSTPDEAAKAIKEMNGKMIGKKPLYVAVAQRREERKAWLQAHFAQIRAPTVLSPLPSGIPGYHAGTPRLTAQQLYYGQGTTGILPPHPVGYGFQQNLLPGMRPGVASNYIMPYQLQRQGHPGQRMGMRRGGNHQPMQQQILQRSDNRSSRFMGNARTGIDSAVVPQGFVGPAMPLPFEGSGMSVNANDVQRPGSVPTSTLTSALASASPKQRTMMLGDQLFPLVERLEPVHAAKVTGMLLEMDQTEVLHLMESPDALKDKVAEALRVLQDSMNNNAGEQPPSMTPNE